MKNERSRRWTVVGAALAIALPAVVEPAAPAAQAQKPATPAVTLVGSLQSELGCGGDWDPTCAATDLVDDDGDGVWTKTFTVPAGTHEYKVAIDDGWAENYGAHAQLDGPNIELALATDMAVTFLYSHGSQWITDDVGAVVATAAGSFQSEIGCPGDWQPGCLRSWLQDPDGDGTYTFTTTALPAGSYAAKVAIDASRDENYGQGGVRDGADITFRVPTTGAATTFSYDAASHVLTISSAGTGHDDVVEWDGVRHDSRDLLYRTPGAAVEQGTPVTLRLRTFHADVTAVQLRLFSLDAGGQQLLPMSVAASAVDCYQAGLADRRCDFWEVTLPNADPDNLWYRFVVSDGPDTDFYNDDTAALDGGVGAMTDDAVDRSWALTVAVPDFTAPEWAREAVIYQIFPDRFRNGEPSNDPQTGEIRYDEPVLALEWGVKPEGYCRNYADGATNCPWRFDSTPPPDSPTKEQPRGRDYFGGDLRGVADQLGDLADMGVTAIYFNPIFDAGSNHGYDTQDYTRVDPAFGTQRDWDRLVRRARRHGIRIILDGVFNHVSSDSPFFDRYGHYPTVGACESVSSPYREWFTFREQAGGPCAGPGGPRTAIYDGWVGFDTIPVLDKRHPAVREYFLTGHDSITRRWLDDGAAGWRLDVSGDASFPDGYWEAFRDVVRSTDPDALTISETWQKDSTLLRMLRGDRLHTTMNYRLRDAVLGLLAPHAFDSKGFSDSGRVISPTEFANRIASIREDYPDAAYFSLMNLLDSHDTERILWTLTPGAETTSGREQDPANVAAGKRRVRIASLIQFTMPGPPTVYYGDEVGVTGDDDPDDRRTYPAGGAGGRGDRALLGHYRRLADVRGRYPALTEGDLRILLADDATGVVAYGRSTEASAAVVVVNRDATARRVTIPVAGYLPDGTRLDIAAGANAPVGGDVRVDAGTIVVDVPAGSARILAGRRLDLDAPTAPSGLRVTGETANAVTLAWNRVRGAAGYHVYASPLSGGGWIRATTRPVTSPTFTVRGLDNARTYHFVVRAVDRPGNESASSNEVTGVPHLSIAWANLQRPPAMTHVVSTVDRTDDVYGQVFIDGATGATGATPSLRTQLGFGPDGSDPAGNAQWTWVEARFNVDAGNNDEFVASLQPESTGAFDYAYRYTVTGGRDWVYADRDGILNGYSADQAGTLTVQPSGDTAAPATPTGLRVVTASPAGIELAWDPSTDGSLDRYEVGRAATAGGPYEVLATVPAGTATFVDTRVAEGATYSYVVQAVDTSFNRSGWSNEVTATAELRTVELVFTVTVPATTDGTGRDVNIAGFLDRLDGDHPQWDPGGTELTQVDATTWRIAFTGPEGTQLEYKYALGSWDYVEKDAACGEIRNRQLTLTYGPAGTHSVADTVHNWRNVAPCGN